MEFWDFIGVVNIVGFYTLRSCREVRKDCKDLRTKIRASYPTVLWNLGEGIGKDSKKDPLFTFAADALFRINNSKSKLAVAEYQISFINLFALSALILVAASVAVGAVVYLVNSGTPELDASAKQVYQVVMSWCLLYIPLVLFSGQLAMIMRAYSLENFISSIHDDAAGELMGEEQV